MLKKPLTPWILTLALATVLLVAGSYTAKLQSVAVGSVNPLYVSLVEILIKIGVITPDKATLARDIVHERAFVDPISFAVRSATSSRATTTCSQESGPVCGIVRTASSTAPNGFTFRPVLFANSCNAFASSSVRLASTTECADKREIVSETVRCTLRNSITNDYCFLRDHPETSCIMTASSSCETEVVGFKGQTLAWSSSCYGLATSSLDGVQSELNFRCPIRRLAIFDPEEALIESAEEDVILPPRPRRTTPAPRAQCHTLTGATEIAYIYNITWVPEVIFGTAPYTYAWTTTGTTTATTSTNFVINYNATGTRTATVVVTDADGRTDSADCSITLEDLTPVAFVGQCGASTSTALTGDSVVWVDSSFGGGYEEAPGIPFPLANHNYTYTWTGSVAGASGKATTTSYTTIGDKVAGVSLSIAHGVGDPETHLYLCTTTVAVSPLYPFTSVSIATLTGTTTGTVGVQMIFTATSTGGVAPLPAFTDSDGGSKAAGVVPIYRYAKTFATPGVKTVTANYTSFDGQSTSTSMNVTIY